MKRLEIRRNIKRILFFLIALFVLVLLFMSWTCLSGARPPHIILISIDTLRADHLGCYGYHRLTSTNIDALAKEGVTFLSAYSHSPKTTPSHMSIMTSLHQDVHQVYLWERGKTGRRLDPSIPTLAEFLRERGYKTVGFTGGGNVSAGYGFDKGFDIYQEGSIKDVLSWLDTNRQRKFFLFFHTYVVHDPYLPPSGYDKIYDRAYAGNIPDSRSKLRVELGSGDDRWWESHDAFWARVNKKDPLDIHFLVAQYDACINYMDNEMIKPLLEKLRGLHIYENTLIIFTADHGEEFNEHKSFEHQDLYAEVLHVPLIIVYPKVIPRDRIIKQLVRLTDIMPTILDISDIKTKIFMQGKSLIPAIEKGKILGLFCYSNWINMKALRTDRYTFIQKTENDGKNIINAFYDRQKDPEEKEDIMAFSQDAVDKIKILLYGELDDCNKRSSRYHQIVAPPLDSKTREKLKSLGYFN